MHGIGCYPLVVQYYQDRKILLPPYDNLRLSIFTVPRSEILPFHTPDPHTFMNVSKGISRGYTHSRGFEFMECSALFYK